MWKCNNLMQAWLDNYLLDDGVARFANGLPGLSGLVNPKYVVEDEYISWSGADYSNQGNDIKSADEDGWKKDVRYTKIWQQNTVEIYKYLPTNLDPTMQIKLAKYIYGKFKKQIKEQFPDQRFNLCFWGEVINEDTINFYLRITEAEDRLAEITYMYRNGYEVDNIFAADNKGYLIEVF